MAGEVCSVLARRKRFCAMLHPARQLGVQGRVGQWGVSDDVHVNGGSAVHLLTANAVVVEALAVHLAEVVLVAAVDDHRLLE